MARSKIDGVIEAVRYNPDGTVRLARGYERHGVVWTDEIMLDRNDLVEKLKQGKVFVTGVRKHYLGGIFETGPALRLTDGYIITNEHPENCDKLAGAGIF